MKEPTRLPKDILVTKLEEIITGNASGISPMGCQPGMCLRFVRKTIQSAWLITYEEFYQPMIHRTTSRIAGATFREHWAGDIEASAKALQLAILPEMRQGGDIVFSHVRGRPFGHIGIMLTPNIVVECGKTQRSLKTKAENIYLTSYENFRPTLVADFSLVWGKLIQ